MMYQLIVNRCVCIFMVCGCYYHMIVCCIDGEVLYCFAAFFKVLALLSRSFET